MAGGRGFEKRFLFVTLWNHFRFNPPFSSGGQVVTTTTFLHTLSFLIFQRKITPHLYFSHISFTVFLTVITQITWEMVSNIRLSMDLRPGWSLSPKILSCVAFLFGERNRKKIICAMSGRGEMSLHNAHYVKAEGWEVSGIMDAVFCMHHARNHVG